MKVVLGFRAVVLVLAGVLVAVAWSDQSVPALAKEPSAPRSLLALVGGQKPRLVRVAPASLRILPGRSLRLESGTPGAAWSADGRRLAVGGAGIWIVDVEEMRLLGSVRSPDRWGSLEPIAWFQSGLLVVLDWAENGNDLLVVDPQNWRIIARRPLDGEVIGRGTTFEGGGRLVLLVMRQDEIGQATLVVVDPNGRFRSVVLGRIPAGRMVVGDSKPMRASVPGLAVDGADRAFVVGAGSLVAEVDLDTLAVDYHELSEPVSLLGRLRKWLEPEARADAVEGSTREARWLGHGLIAVSGNDTEFTTGAVRSKAAGLKIIDTRTWSVRMIDERVFQVTVTGDLLLATSPRWNSATREHAGIGLVAYSATGERRFHLFDSEPIWEQQTAGRFAYVQLLLGGALRTAIVDLGSGEVLREVRGRMPLLLVAGAATS